MKRKDINIHRLQSTTIIDSTDRFMSYDHKAGDEDKPVQCITSFKPPAEFLSELTASKIVKVNEFFGASKQWEVFSFMLYPQFAYTNQKLESILYELFVKYNL